VTPKRTTPTTERPLASPHAPPHGPTAPGQGLSSLWLAREAEPSNSNKPRAGVGGNGGAM